MNERESRRVKKEAPDPSVELVRPPPAGTQHSLLPARTVDRVADDGMAQRSKVNADLVGPSGVKANGEKIRGTPTLETPEAGQ